MNIDKRIFTNCPRVWWKRLFIRPKW